MDRQIDRQKDNVCIYVYKVGNNRNKILVVFSHKSRAPNFNGKMYYLINFSTREGGQGGRGVDRRRGGHDSNKGVGDDGGRRRGNILLCQLYLGTPPVIILLFRPSSKECLYCLLDSYAYLKHLERLKQVVRKPRRCSTMQQA